VPARWDAGDTEPWLILTDLAPERAAAAWYGMRSWIAGGFNDLKRGGWQWHQTKTRASRLWFAMAVAPLWVVSGGGEGDAMVPASSLDALPERHVAQRRATHRARPRRLRCFRRGILTMLAALLSGLELEFVSRAAPRVREPHHASLH
jgi:hypothetical protein